MNYFHPFLSFFFKSVTKKIHDRVPLLPQAVSLFRVVTEDTPEQVLTTRAAPAPPGSES